jgi:hypothetical protein
MLIDPPPPTPPRRFAEGGEKKALVMRSASGPVGAFSDSTALENREAAKEAAAMNRASRKNL